MKIAKWGNSLAVRLPAAEVHRLCLVEGDEVEVTLTKVNVPTSKTSAEIRAAFDALDRLRGTLPADFRFDRDEANAR